MTPDLARDGLRVLQQRMLQAVIDAPDHAALIQIQRDLVEGARRLLDALHQAYLAGDHRHGVLTAYVDVAEFYHDASDALARYERQPPTQQPRRRGLLLH